MDSKAIWIYTRTSFKRDLEAHKEELKKLLDNQEYVETETLLREVNYLNFLIDDLEKINANLSAQVASKEELVLELEEKYELIYMRCAVNSCLRQIQNNKNSYPKQIISVKFPELRIPTFDGNVEESKIKVVENKSEDVPIENLPSESEYEIPIFRNLKDSLDLECEVPDVDVLESVPSEILPLEANVVYESPVSEIENPFIENSLESSNYKFDLVNLEKICFIPNRCYDLVYKNTICCHRKLKFYYKSDNQKFAKFKCVSSEMSWIIGVSTLWLSKDFHIPGFKRFIDYEYCLYGL